MNRLRGRKFPQAAIYVKAAIATFINFVTGTTGANIALTNAGLTTTMATGGGFDSAVATGNTAGHSTGKFYFQALINVLTSTNFEVGIASSSFGFSGGFLGTGGFTSLGWDHAGAVLVNGSTAATIQSYAAGDTVCVAIDLGSGLYWFRTNGGNWNNSGTANPATGVGGLAISLAVDSYFPGVTLLTTGDQATFNFGATAYSQTPPVGFGNW